MGLDLFAKSAPFPAAELLDELGFVSGAPAEDAFAIAAEHRFRWIEISCNAPRNYPDTFDRERTLGIRRLAEQHRVRLGLHTASYVNTAEVMPGVRESVRDYLLGQVQLAADLGCEYAIIHCGFHFSAQVDLYKRRLIETLKPVLDLAERVDVPLLVENMNRQPDDAEVHYFMVQIGELQELFQALPTPYLGLSIDLGHINMLGTGVAPMLDAFPTRIANGGLSDNHGRTDDHIALGDGTLDVVGSFEAFASRGHRVPMVFELGGERRQKSLAYVREHLAG